MSEICSRLVGIGLQRPEKEIQKQKFSWISFFALIRHFSFLFSLQLPLDSNGEQS